MRITSIGIAAWFNLMCVAISAGGPPQQEQTVNSLVMAPRTQPSLDDQKEIAALARSSKPEILTWEKAYTQAVVRARAGRGDLLQTLDPAALAQQADRLGVADFTRFRNEFKAGGAFRDPAPDMLKLSARLQTIENVRSRVVILENLTRLLQERIQGEAAGVSRLDLDMLLAALLKCRQDFDHQRTLFRNGLDELKVALGLSPQAAVILDQNSMAAFHEVFESVANWLRQPARNLENLPRIIGKLPEMGDAIVVGQPALSGIDANPDQWEEVMAKAARLAVRKQADPAEGAAEDDARVQLELQIRRRVRGLAEIRRAYANATHEYMTAIRIHDQALERLLSPPSGHSPPRSLLLEQFVSHTASFTSLENQLGDLWTEFRAERLTLYREIGALPYTDWNAFYADLTARSKSADRRVRTDQ